MKTSHRLGRRGRGRRIAASVAAAGALATLVGCNQGAAPQESAGSAGDTQATVEHDLVQGSAPEAEAKEWEIDGLCDPATDGWMAQPVPIPEDVIDAAKRGEPAWIQYPAGYQHLPGFGVPYCRTYSRLDPGATEFRRFGVWEVRCLRDADCPAGSRCPLENLDQLCAVECTKDSDCSIDKNCSEYGGRIRSCQCDVECLDIWNGAVPAP